MLPRLSALEPRYLGAGGGELTEINQVPESSRVAPIALPVAGSRSAGAAPTVTLPLSKGSSAVFEAPRRKLKQSVTASPDTCGRTRMSPDLFGRCASETAEVEGTTKARTAAARCVHARALGQVEGRAARSRRRGERGAGHRPHHGRCRLGRSILRRAADMPDLSLDALAAEGVPLLVPVDSLEEDPDNPRTEFPDEEIAELARDIALRGILQPIVVRPAAEGRPLPSPLRCQAPACGEEGRASRSCRSSSARPAHDAYAQVAENQKRHGLTPLDLARFIRSRADAGESNAEIARRLGIDLTSVAHHLALLTLTPELEEAFRSGRCTSPRTLYELAKLQKTRPEQVKAIVGREGEITRSAVASIKKTSRSPRRVQRKTAGSRRRTSLADQANALCSRFESLLERMTKAGAPVTPDDLAALRRRLAELAGMSEVGSPIRSCFGPRLSLNGRQRKGHGGEGQADGRVRRSSCFFPQARHDLARPRVLHGRPARPAPGAEGAGGPRRRHRVRCPSKRACRGTRRPGVHSRSPGVDSAESPQTAPHVKLSVRVSAPAARRLDLNGRAAGLSRGAYLMRLIDGAPPVIPSSGTRSGLCRAQRLGQRSGSPQSRHQPPDASPAHWLRQSRSRIPGAHGHPGRRRAQAPRAVRSRDRRAHGRPPGQGMGRRSAIQPRRESTMSKDRSPEAQLVEWGDRLFYPGNRIVKANTPRLHWGTSRATMIRHRSKPSSAERPRSWSRSPGEGGA